MEDHEGAIVPDLSRRSEVVVRYVTAEIQSGQLTVGDRLPSERDLATLLGVSRPIVREGYRTLESLGIIDVRPGSGVYVTERSMRTAAEGGIWASAIDVVDVVDCADLLAERCGQLAAARINDDQIEALRRTLADQRTALEIFDLEAILVGDGQFHTLIAEISGNAVIASFEVLSTEVLRRDRTLLLGYDADRSLIEHKQIIDALASRDPLRAGAAMRFHAIRTQAVMRDHLRRSTR